MQSFTSKRTLIFGVSLLLVALCVILAGLHNRKIRKDAQLTQSRSESSYAKIIANSSGIQNEKYPLRHPLINGLIGEVRFLNPQDLKDNTETAIIVLGDRPLDDTTPTVDMVYRVLKGIDLAKKFPKAILIMCGGATKGPTPEAQMMGLIAWVRGVDPLKIMLENKSQTTDENAKNTANIVGSKSIRQVFIITEQSRLEEAVATFQRYGNVFKNIQGVESDVTRSLIIEQMEHFLMTHDDRIVRDRLHYIKIGKEYKAFRFAVFPQGLIPLLSNEVSSKVAYQKYLIGSDKKLNEINYLFDLMENSSLVFERNGQKGSGKDAVKILRFKLNEYNDKINTTEDFIDKVASFSSHTKKSYYVILPEGKKLLLKDLLYTELKKLRNQSNQ